MKNFGNMVLKYASGKVASKYEAIIVGSVVEYEEKQLADLKRFLKDDFNRQKDWSIDNPLAQEKYLAAQKKVIEAEIHRLGIIAQSRERIRKQKESKETKPKKKAKKKKAK